MKQLIKLGILSQLICTPIFALNPVQGLYIGLLGEISHGPSNSQIYFREDAMVFNGTVGYSSVSGGGALMLGYTYNQFRGEAEFLINRISTGPVTVGSCVIQNIDVTTPTGACPVGAYDHFKDKALGYSGNSTAMYGLVNGIWNFINYENPTEISPYVGIGLGMSKVRNGSSFVNTNTLYSHGQTLNSTGAAYQGILGVSYYMDDYTWCSMDYRYLKTNLKADIRSDLGTNIPSKAYALQTLNFTINAAFDTGAAS